MTGVPALGAILVARARVRAFLVGKRWPNEEVMEVELAVHEALANAIRHGCKTDPSKQVECYATLEAGGKLVIIVRDPGPGFDVTVVPNPIEGVYPLKTSGRGVFLMNQMMDTVEFADEGRQVLMRKRPDSRPMVGATGLEPVTS